MGIQDTVSLITDEPDAVESRRRIAAIPLSRSRLQEPRRRWVVVERYNFVSWTTSEGGWRRIATEIGLMMEDRTSLVF